MFELFGMERMVFLYIRLYYVDIFFTKGRSQQLKKSHLFHTFLTRAKNVRKSFPSSSHMSKITPFSHLHISTSWHCLLNHHNNHIISSINHYITYKIIEIFHISLAVSTRVSFIWRRCTSSMNSFLNHVNRYLTDRYWVSLSLNWVECNCFEDRRVIQSRLLK